MPLHKRTANLAGLLLWFIPCCIVTVRITVTAKECPPAPALTLDDLAAAFGTGDTGIAQERLCIAAVGEAGTGKKLAETSLLDHHHASAFIAGNIRDFIGNLDRADDIFRLFERFVKRHVEFAQQIVFVKRAVCDFIQLSLKICRELHIDNVLEIFFEHIRHDEAKFRRSKLFFAAFHIAALLDGLDDRRIGTRPTDPHLLQCLDDGRIVIARRGFGEVLFGLQFGECQRIPRLKFRQKCVLLLLCNLRAHIDGGIALECELRPVCTQTVSPRLNLRRNGIVNGSRHLARRKTLPDERIEAQLIPIQILLDIGGGSQDARRADRLMRVLCLLAHHVDIGARRNVFLSIGIREKVPRLLNGKVGDACRIRSHIGDETGRPVPSKDNALVELLGNHHRTSRGKAELACRILLKRACRKRRSGFLAAFAALHVLDAELLSRKIIGQRPCFCLTVQ